MLWNGGEKILDGQVGHIELLEVRLLVRLLLSMRVLVRGNGVSSRGGFPGCSCPLGWLRGRRCDGGRHDVGGEEVRGGRCEGTRQCGEWDDVGLLIGIHVLDCNPCEVVTGWWPR